MTTSQDLVDLTVGALLTVGTDALDRVYSPGDWPTWNRQYPVLKVSCPDEDKTSLGPNAIEFDVVSTIRVTARVECPAAADDGGAAAAEEALGRLKQQIEQAVINYTTIMPLVSHFPFVRARTAFSSDGEQHLGELQLDIGMMFYQGPEDFYVPPAAALTDIRFQSTLPDPVALDGELQGPVLDVQPPS